MSSLVKAAIVLLVSSIILNIISVIVINNLSINIVNGVLYNYNLQLNADWAGKYESFLWLLFGSVASSIILVGLASALSFLLGKTHDNNSRLFGYLTIALGAAANFLAIIAFFLIDQIVNSDLYAYGLVFSLNWYEPYFVQGNIFLAMQIFSLAFVLISFVLVFLTKPSQLRFNSQKISSLFLIIIGGFLIIFSMVYIPSTDPLPTTALVGLGMIFWGMIVGYISSGEYVKLEVLESTNLSYVETLNEIVQKLHPKETAVFLPSKYLSNSKSNMVYFTENKTIELQNIREKFRKTENNQGLKSRLMIAPGNQLLRLFEKTLGKNFADGDFSFFEINIPRLLINELEIAQNVTIKAKENIVKVKIKNLISSDFSREIDIDERLKHSVGSPLLSAVASALANATNNPTIIGNTKVYADENDVEIEYRLIKERGV
ncbi:MAG: hypothetical protein P8Y24_12225 [Gammaproteobacteria bacterium]